MRRGSWLICVLLVLVLAGCGGGPKEDVPIFMMSKTGIPGEVAEKLEKALIAKVGETPTVAISASPMFSMDKMIVEIAAGGNGILIIPGEQFHGMSKQGGFVPLDDVANPADFPDGVLELPVEEEGKPADKSNPKLEKHLYGIPMEHTKWFKELELNGKDLYAFIPQNAKDIEKAKQVLKHIAQK
ncbi:hypothetical protein SAMN02799630_02404 [Paenibacillus sp. UNCCL117]|uniref:hypothetical protein n=1 Tax=unclassified Paenibacillus TaxID=185978 RepID=UPI000881E3BA|nr:MULTISPECIES: hypothetical protein [unclassified Paenibacillus]SDC00569.1 hypothetical protein SAMN04488602_10172 [Paenibacillus sp. cl123]SFW36392.1 hypothetical protein SAMN02799630_02404 [Paenibacillus sp. UNCCL117]